MKSAGIYTVSFNASGLPSGVYLYKLQSIPVDGHRVSFVDVKKMIVVK